jgi:hypothetical protein
LISLPFLLLNFGSEQDKKKQAGHDDRNKADH